MRIWISAHDVLRCTVIPAVISYLHRRYKMFPYCCLRIHRCISSIITSIAFNNHSPLPHAAQSPSSHRPTLKSPQLYQSLSHTPNHHPNLIQHEVLTSRHDSLRRCCCKRASSFYSRHSLFCQRVSIKERQSGS